MSDTNGDGPHIEIATAEARWRLDDDLPLEDELALRRQRLEELQESGEDKSC